MEFTISNSPRSACSCNFICTLLLLWCVAMTSSKRPNILLIVADDLGHNDLGYMNEDMITPNLDKLAKNGIRLSHAYVQPVCSPSRSALMTGFQPYHTGLQHYVITEEQPVGLPLNLTTLPQLLRKSGYRTHMVGKWHLGYCNWSYTPLHRGFESFVGYYNGMEEYFSHSRSYGGSQGLDFRFNNDPYPQAEGIYSTYVFADRATDVIRRHNTTEPLFLYLPFQAVHFPLEVPKRYEQMYEHVKNGPRRKYSGMVTAMDEAVGNVTRMLATKGMLEDTLIFFTTDNGGYPPQAGNNWPLRGAKTTLWEGGTRGLAFVSGPNIPKGEIYEGLLHVADWFPTILSAAELRAQPGIDGNDQWVNIRTNSGPYPRQDMVYNVDRMSQNGAYRYGDYKILVGSPGHLNDWYPVPKSRHGTGFPDNVTEDSLLEAAMKDAQNSAQKLRLYNLRRDPEERVDLSPTQPDVLAELYARYLKYKDTEVAPNFPPETKRASPDHFGGVWSPGWC